MISIGVVRMRFCLSLVAASITLALGACSQHVSQTAVVAATASANEVSDLDAMMYGARPPLSETARRAQAAVRVAATLENRPYTLDAGDKLRVVVFGQDALSNNYTVNADGRVSLPLIGAVNARGLTTAQLAGAITASLKKSFIRDPSVAVEIETYRPFFVLGEVTFPGQYPYVPGMTVESAAAIAGGYTPRAYKDSFFVTRKVRGVPVRLTVRPQTPVRPGDTVTVDERWF
jgi:polysaccharide export outer membrane protein